jgi:hypothetical protein
MPDPFQVAPVGCFVALFDLSDPVSDNLLANSCHTWQTNPLNRMQDMSRAIRQARLKSLDIAVHLENTNSAGPANPNAPVHMVRGIFSRKIYDNTFNGSKSAYIQEMYPNPDRRAWSEPY